MGGSTIEEPPKTTIGYRARWPCGTPLAPASNPARAHPARGWPVKLKEVIEEDLLDGTLFLHVDLTAEEQNIPRCQAAAALPVALVVHDAAARMARGGGGGRAHRGKIHGEKNAEKTPAQGLESFATPTHTFTAHTRRVSFHSSLQTSTGINLMVEDSSLRFTRLHSDAACCAWTAKLHGLTFDGYGQQLLNSTLKKLSLHSCERACVRHERCRFARSPCATSGAKAL